MIYFSKVLNGLLVFLATLMVGYSSESSEIPPNLDQVQYGYNVLLSKIPHEQRLQSVGSKLFILSNDNTNDDFGYANFVIPDQIEDLSTVFQCVSNRNSFSTSFSKSSETLNIQEEQSSIGFDQESTIGVEAKGVSGETTIRNALVFGNSDRSESHKFESDSGFTHSFDTFAKRILYSTEVGYHNIRSEDWDDDLLDATSLLGDNPTKSQILLFFKQFGTHGLIRAVFGETCFSSLYISSEASQEQMHSFTESNSQKELGLLWFSKSRSETSIESETETSSSGFQYKVSDRNCRGSLDLNDNCNALQSTGLNSPTILEWNYKPIWKMNIPTLSLNAKKMMKLIFQNIFNSLFDCSDIHCNSNGACGLKESIWRGGANDNKLFKLFDNNEDYTIFWDKKTCFCFNGFEGNRCNIKIKAAVTEHEPFFDDFFGKKTEPFSFKIDQNRQLCGMNSVIDIFTLSGEKHIYRKFRFESCNVIDIINKKSNVKLIGNDILTDLPNLFNQDLDLKCKNDEAMIGLEVSRRATTGPLNDVKYQLVCKKMETHEIKFNECQQIGNLDTIEVPLSLRKCPEGTVLHGFKSKFIGDKDFSDNFNVSDRTFQIRCCPIVIKDEV